MHAYIHSAVALLKQLSARLGKSLTHGTCMPRRRAPSAGGRGRERKLELKYPGGMMISVRLVGQHRAFFSSSTGRK